MAKYNEKIKQLRKICGYSLEEVANKIGVSAATMQRYESGAIVNIPYETLINLANFFHVKPEYFFADNKSDDADYVLTDNEKILLEITKGLSPDKFDNLLMYAKMLKQYKTE